ncbi:MAG: type II secretion system F family protein [Oscillospiraceae bacterium]|jgi:type IV pilus assembly protein PilC|nr:type II secretion system F family protein [Oscillospiraceae bacterium]
MDENKEAKQRLKKLPSGDLSVFCFQLSLVLKAGIPLNEGLSTLGDEASEMAESKQKIRGMLGKTIRSMASAVEIGDPLSHAMKKEGVFPGYLVNMVEIGEGTGKLDNVLEALGDYYERDQYVKAKIRNSMMYPVFLFAIMSVVIVLLVSRVFPIFSDMIESMGGSLSESQQAVSAFAGSLAAGTYAMYIILGLAALAVAIALLAKTKPGKNIVGLLAAVFPLTKNINKKIAASRFANAMSMTLASGMDIDSALNMSANLIENPVYKNKFKECVKEIEEGGSFSGAIGKTGAFSGMYVKFIEIGQKTGTADAVMKKIADICDGEADTSLNNATSVIEPLLVGILSVVIGIILISVMIPLVQVMSGIS